MRFDVKEAGRAIYRDKALRLFWAFFVFVAIVVGISKCSEPLRPCADGGDFGRSWYGQRCIPYCPPNPRECD